MKNKYLVMLSLFAAINFPQLIFGQTPDESAKSSIGIRAGYSIFFGTWNKVRFLPDVNLLKDGISLGADIEFRLSDRFTLALDGGYESLSGSDWEEYAKSQGSDITVSASMGYLALLIRPHIKVTKPDIIRFEIGPAIIFSSGTEMYNGKSYKYDFLPSFGFGGQIGLEYDRVLSDYFAASLKVEGLFIPSGVSYADGESRMLTTLPVTLGIRCYF